MSTRVRRDIEVQRRYDERRTNDWQVYDMRLAAVVGARLAVRHGEPGAKYALRQALVDLSSVCEELAGLMVAPDAQLLAA